MNQLCFIRKIDELGRIVIPIEMRKELGIKEKDSLELSIENSKISIRKEEPHCIFCNSTNNLKSFLGKKICGDCIKDLK